MKIKVKKGTKAKIFTIKSWSDVTLANWIKLIEAETMEKIENAQEVINVMTEMPKTIINQLSISNVADILKKISELQAQEHTQLRKIIKINNDEYGFLPDLEEITLGEYADLEHFISGGVEKNMHKIMAVLYRPIIEKEGNYYTVETYDSSKMRIRAERFLQMKAENVQSALVFFWLLGKKLLMTSQLYLTEKMQEMNKRLMSNLQKNGVGLA
jgi:hypothetical protein